MPRTSPHRSRSTMASFLFALISAVHVTAYHLVRDYSGDNFFSGWDFYDHNDDSTFGEDFSSCRNVFFVNQNDALSRQLAFVRNGNAVIKVDNTTNVAYGQPRDSIRITTKDAFPLGTIWIIDIVHLPWGCSVWPVFWSLGQGQWPTGGEMDVIEYVNLRPNNQMSLHTSPGCSHPNNTSELGNAQEPDCSQPSGCTVFETKQNNIGQQFNAAGGGVWATVFDVSGVRMWFWSRPDVPSSIKNANQTSLDFTNWGTASAVFSNTTCDMNKFFSYQNLILEITLCGEWAGLPKVYQPDCGSAGPTGKCYDDFVVGPGSPHFDQAYFEISYLHVYATDGAIPMPASSPSRSGSILTCRTSWSGNLFIAILWIWSSVIALL